MNKLISIILPYLLICLIFIYDHMFPYKDLMIVGIVILFPIIFIFQGIIHSNSVKHMLIGFFLSSVIILLFFKEWYYIDGTFDLITRYLLLGFIAFAIKKIIDFFKKNKLNNI
ncbi:hypothetical protein FDA52_16500 [Clostridium botulinum]|uniref:hypothetical protein n=1 Tax=Clostridium botulinum TaxID=1491 RepID=UPI0007739040|nr:hypothetical protein [Clostridium botulinum]NFE96228.1 hypothetical protein [Clostridium botulinum]NFI54517.1 hypothetical protein [Clostridium botulinum]NFL39779.1 hypothetical protein [Clostridium botulinum]NFL66647.1 hypothetical protein [Clostridium botulinum]NFN09626.1 hypothetical protein [Clostridium botulinum]